MTNLPLRCRNKSIHTGESHRKRKFLCMNVMRKIEWNHRGGKVNTEILMLPYCAWELNLSLQ